MDFCASQDLKALVRKRKPLNHASRLEVRCGALKWQLLGGGGSGGSGGERAAMVTAAIAELSLHMSRNKDLSGVLSQVKYPPAVLMRPKCSANLIV